jgi:hypothetical protein
MDTDLNSNAAGTGGFFETKWLYLETPLMGPGSIMPFIPVATTMRAGAQPARGHEYKVGIHFGGDFPGVTLESMWAPNLKSTVTYAQIGEGLDRMTAPNRATNNEDFAILASVEMEIFKGLTVKPTYSYASYTCGNGQGSGNLGTEAKGGFNPNVCDGLNNLKFDTRRHTLGGDLRWTAGPFTVSRRCCISSVRRSAAPLTTPRTATSRSRRGFLTPRPASARARSTSRGGSCGRPV